AGPRPPRPPDRAARARLRGAKAVSSVIWNVGAGHFLALSALLFAIGVVGALMRRNAIIVLMSVELMLNAGNLTLLTFARQRHDMKAHGLAMLVIALAAAE